MSSPYYWGIPQLVIAVKLLLMVTFSIFKSELFSAILSLQDMLFFYEGFNSMVIAVEIPMNFCVYKK